MRTFKRIAKIAAVFAVAAFINYLVCVALVPYGYKSEVMWKDYRESQDIDMVFLGTSLMERSANPFVVDERLGTNSFNMATPAQALEDTYLGLEQAINDHHVKRAVIGLEYGNLNSKDEKRGGVFVREKTKGETPLAALHDWVVSTDPDTLFWSSTGFSMLFFPWQVQHVGMDEVVRNVQMKLDGTSVYEAAMVTEPGWNYLGKGFGGFEKVFDRTAKPAQYYVNHYKLVGATEFDESRLQVLARICDLCRDNDVDLVLVMSPLQDYQVVAFGDCYQALSDSVASFAADHGARYYDFNLARPALFDNSDSFYCDSQHMNIAGAKAFSTAVTTLLDDLDEGRTVDDLFCTYAERIARVDTVANACFVTARSNGQSIVLKAESVVGPGVQAEYRYSAKPASNDGDYVVIQDYSSVPDCSYVPPERGKYQVKLEVRKQGAEEPAVTDTRTIEF